MRVRSLSAVELLVLAAIIATLAAMLLPVLSSGDSRRAQCIYNLRQLALAWQFYAND